MNSPEPDAPGARPPLDITFDDEGFPLCPACGHDELVARAVAVVESRIRCHEDGGLDRPGLVVADWLESSEHGLPVAEVSCPRCAGAWDEQLFIGAVMELTRTRQG